MKAVLNNIDFEYFFKYEKILNTLTPIPIIGTLNSSFIISEKGAFLYLRDSVAFLEVKLDGEISWEDWPEEVPKVVGALIEYQKLFYIFNSYSEDDLKGLKISLYPQEEDGSSIFRIRASNDRLKIFHQEMSKEQIEDMINDFIKLTNESSKSIINEGWNKEDFVSGVAQCMSFIGNDERKNNALALYPDKLIANDKRHVFIYHFDSGDYFHGIDSWMSIHRKGAKILSFVGTANLEFSLSESKVVFWSKGIMGIINNSISNIAPPTEEDLNNIRSNTKVFSIPPVTLKEASNFFSGFYTVAMDWNPLTIEKEFEDKVTFLLKDSGSSGFGAYNIRRTIEVTDLTPEKFSVTIINDSLKSFLSKIYIADNTEVDVYTDDEVPSVYINGGKTEIYLAKLQ